MLFQSNLGEISRKSSYQQYRCLEFVELNKNPAYDWIQIPRIAEKSHNIGQPTRASLKAVGNQKRIAIGHSATSAWIFVLSRERQVKARGHGYIQCRKVPRVERARELKAERGGEMVGWDLWVLRKMHANAPRED
ncbi:hypothetical protein QAD02_018467 [Eretmocerus hayati]|uniref:Uncharacterized protein n=1 Tax=Eretmocerus hayati TaxID=131215 RepID=A0ACC2PGG5_9HYME|nr:hypothetical protein QAD02_018467 [Eretmocerus hayati]